ncbi:TIGR02117 family protein [Rhodophyticola sp. CCM32]|uniref:TIGR02117 family protein n=1 Tax=Rhodophyticola sp. CCM32 TaxID=2916397 RepID=UPI00143CE01C|nr:TIGR02117 family protein [Rhodophyticola sp. CCM32]
MWRGLRQGLVALCGVLGAYLVAAAVGGLVPGQVVDIPATGRAQVEIGLISGPIHYDFILPATAETRRSLASAEAVGVPVQNPLVESFLVGWGARKFYTTAGTYADITGGAVMRAVTGDRSVLRVEVLGALPSGLEYDRLQLSQAQYSALLSAITDSTTGIPILDAGFTETDGFLEAEGRFHIFRTCNTWITDMLRAAGMPAGIWTPTPYSVRLSLWWYG